MDQQTLMDIGFKLTMTFIPFLFALCFHEFAHGLVAKWLGDNTAEMAGRLSLNPVVHADPIGTWLLPILAIVFRIPFFFGYAKPVPVNSRNLKRPLQDMFWIALAGPVSNMLLAFVGAIALGFVLVMNSGGVGNALSLLLKNFIVINLFLAIFNMLPVHPLDGAKVIAPFLPIRWNMWLEQNQRQLSMMLMFAVLLMGPVLALPVDWAAQHLMRCSVLIAELMV